MGTQPLQPLFLLDDEPISSAADDFLTREDDARTIAGAVLGTTGPFSVGIYGEWGTGKTSLLHHVKSLLEAKDADNPKHLAYPYLVPVFFNAWQHEKDAEPLAHLAEAVDAAISKRLKEVETVTGTVNKQAVEWLRSAHMAARSLIYATSVDTNADPIKELANPAGLNPWKFIPFFRISPKDAIDRYEKLQRESGDPDSKLWKKHVGDSVSRAVLRSFRTNHTLLDKVRPGTEKIIPRVVIFIDDMDRCLAEDAFKLLQAIKLALAQPGFIFVMTLDPVALQPFLDKKVSDSGTNAAAGSKAIYLDKLVQLPYPLRLHDEQFSAYVHNIVHKRLKSMLVAPAEVDKVDSDSSIAPQWQVFKQLARVLDIASQRNPRTLVRRINTLLTDARVAPLHVKAQLDEDQNKAEGIFMGLCLVRHTLRHLAGEQLTAQLAANQPLCNQIATRGLTACAEYVAALSSGRGDPSRSDPSHTGPMSGNQPGDTELLQGRDLIKDLNRWRSFDALLKTDPGQRWLAKPDERTLVETFYAKRPDAKPAAPGSPPSASVSPTPKQGPGPGPWPDGDPQWHIVAPVSEPLRSERDLIQRAIRAELELPANATLTPDHFARVTKLNLNGDAISDAGLAWIAGHVWPLSSLTKLYLHRTKVTSDGMRHIAAPDSPLSGLTHLDASRTQVDDQGVATLLVGDTSLRSLAWLDVRDTQVTHQRVAELSAKCPATKILHSSKPDTSTSEAWRFPESRPDVDRYRPFS